MGRIWALIPFWGQFAAICGLVAALSLVVWRVHHNIEKAGYDRCMNEFKELSQKQAYEAAQEIIKVENETQEKKASLRAEPDYLGPVSPLVGRTIERMRAQPRPATGRSIR